MLKRVEVIDMHPYSHKNKRLIFGAARKSQELWYHSRYRLQSGKAVTHRSEQCCVCTLLKKDGFSRVL